MSARDEFVDGFNESSKAKTQQDINNYILARNVLRYSSLCILVLWSAIFFLELFGIYEYITLVYRERVSTSSSPALSPSSSSRISAISASCFRICFNRKSDSQSASSSSSNNNNNMNNSDMRRNRANGAIKTAIAKNELKFKLFLIITTISIIVASCIIIYLEFAPPFSVSKYDCDVYSKLLPLTYCANSQFLYAFFLTRSTLLDGFFQKHFLYRAIFLYLKVGTFIFIPFVMLPLNVAFWFGSILSDGYCIETLNGFWLIILFLVGNFLYSVGFMFIFVEPLRQNAVIVAKQNEGMSKAIKSLVWKNVALSTVAIITSVCNLIFMSIAYVVMVGDIHHKYDDIHVWFLAGAYYDMSVNALCAKMMTNAWVPDRFRYLCTKSPNVVENDQPQEAQPLAENAPSNDPLGESMFGSNQYTVNDMRILSLNNLCDESGKAVSFSNNVSLKENKSETQHMHIHFPESDIVAT